MKHVMHLTVTPEQCDIRHMIMFYQQCRQQGYSLFVRTHGYPRPITQFSELVSQTLTKRSGPLRIDIAGSNGAAMQETAEMIVKEPTDEIRI